MPLGVSGYSDFCSSLLCAWETSSTCLHRHSRTPRPSLPGGGCQVHGAARRCLFLPLHVPRFLVLSLYSAFDPNDGDYGINSLPSTHSLQTLTKYCKLLQRGIKVKAYRLVLSRAHRGSWSNWKGSRIFKKKEVWPNFNPCHFHFSYPVDLGDFIYTVSLSLGIGNQAFMEIIKSTYSTLKGGLTDRCC